MPPKTIQTEIRNRISESLNKMNYSLNNDVKICEVVKNLAITHKLLNEEGDK